MADSTRQKRLLHHFLLVLPVAVSLLLWQLLSQSGWISELILPAPTRVMTAASDIGWTLLSHVGATVARIVLGLAAGLLLGSTLGVLMYMYPAFYIASDGLVETGRAVPPVALVPFFILIFGFAEYGKLLLVALGTCMIIAVATFESLRRVDPAVARVGQVARLGRWEMLRMVLWPAALPAMRASVRIALATAVALVVTAEFMGARYGLGYLVNVSKVTLTTPTMLLAIILLGWINWSLDRLVRFIFDHYCAWDLRSHIINR